jgi:hypothetical protein
MRFAPLALLACVPAWAGSIRLNGDLMHALPVDLTSYQTSSTTPASPLPVEVSTSWTPNGTPGSGDSCEITGPMVIAGTWTCGTVSINGANAQLTWDGNNDTVNLSGVIRITNGCPVAGAYCPTAYAVNLTQTPNAPGNVITWNDTGLTSGQYLFTDGDPPGPYYFFAGRLANSVANVGSGGLLYHVDQFDSLDQITWSVANSMVLGGGTLIYVQGLGGLTVDNLSSTGASGPIVHYNGDTSETGTATGTAGTNALTLSLATGQTYGAVVGSTILGVGILPGTTLTAVGLSSVSSAVTLSSDTCTGPGTPYAACTAAFVSGGDITVQTACSFTKSGQILGTHNEPIFNDFEHTQPPCTVSGNFLFTDSAGTYSPSLTNLGATISGNLGLSYYKGSGTQYAIATEYGSPSYTAQIQNNAISGFCTQLSADNYMASSGNFFSANLANESCDPQGACIFGFGAGTSFTSTNDVCAGYNDPGQALVFFLNNTNGVTPSSPSPIINNMTVVSSNTSVSGSSFVVGFGETDGSYKFSVANAALCNSIVYGGQIGIESRDTTTTYLSNCGGVGSSGVGYNATYGQVNSAYCGSSNTPPCSPVGPNFDNGMNTQPNVLYHDLTTNPNFLGTTTFATIDAPWAACDGTLGNLGTVGGVSANFFNRWRSAYTPTYTIAQLLACLQEPFTPTNAAFKTASSTGSYIGALAPQPTVVSYNVLSGMQSYNVIGTSRNRLPWEITGIQVVFSEPIAVGNANSLGGVTATGLSGLGTTTLTWTISPLALGDFPTTLAGSGANALQDAAGNALAGGAGFSRNLKVLYGDFNDDGVVNTLDFTQVNAARSLPYNIFADMNGDGVVNTTDVQIVRTQEGSSLP